jgi:Skp family chaperone for outer membrane proteins
MKRNLIRHVASTAMIALVAGALLVGCDAKPAGDTQMKFVNVEKVLVESGLVQQEQAHLKAVNENLHKGLQLAEQSYAKLPADKVEAARQADKNVIEQQWKGQQNAARRVVMKALKTASDSYRTEKKIAVIMPMQSAVSVAPELDVTADLTEKLKAAKVDFGKVPEITLKTAQEPGVKTGSK